MALAAGAALLSAFVALGWRSFAAAWAGLDFNGALFEDFLGPYWQTASALAGGQSTPAEGYLYPAFGAWLLAPITALGDGAASWACAGLMLAAAALLLSSLFILRPPRGTLEAAAVGAACLLAHPLVHGAYWGQAALPVAALTLAAFAAWSRGRTMTGGALVGVAAAIKLTPLVFLALPALRAEKGESGKALGWIAGSFLLCAAVLPLITMGPAGFMDFHLEAARQLQALAKEASTAVGGRGARTPERCSLERPATGPSGWGRRSGSPPQPAPPRGSRRAQRGDAALGPRLRPPRLGALAPRHPDLAPRAHLGGGGTARGLTAASSAGAS